MNYLIRRATHQDSTKIIEAHRRSIREVCAKDYNAEQISAWSGKNFSEDRWCQTIDTDFVWVISDDIQNIFGFGHLKLYDDSKAEIAGLYFVPEVIGTGFGKKILHKMLEECRSKNIFFIQLSSTKTARSFYSRCGFLQMGEASFVQIGGLPIECFNMEMCLSIPN